MRAPKADKEDGAGKAFLRLSQQIQAPLARLPIGLAGDALYACRFSSSLPAPAQAQRLKQAQS